MLRLVASLVLFALPVQAAEYLTYSTLAAAQARSQAECTARGCDGVHTIYWWAVVPNTSNGSGAVMIDGTPYDTTGLTAAEQAALIDEATATSEGYETLTWQAEQGQ